MEKIRELHAVYCRLTGQEVQLDSGREMEWAEWCRKGFTVGDLVLVIKRIQAGIRKGERNKGALRFSNLVWRPDLFEEELAMAKAEARGGPGRSGGEARRTEKQMVLRATGRNSTEGPSRSGDKGNEAKSLKEVLESAAFKEFVKLKETLK